MQQASFRLSFITLGVSNFDAMFAFYESLGFSISKVSHDPQHPFAMFDMGGVTLALYPHSLLSQQAGCEVVSHNTSMSLSLNVTNPEQVDSLLQLAQAKGALITRQPFTPAWGGVCAYFKDPEGNLWEIVWHDGYLGLIPS